MARSLRRRRALARAPRKRARSPPADARVWARGEARVWVESPPWRSVAVDMVRPPWPEAAYGPTEPLGLCQGRWTSAAAERSSAAAGETCAVYIHGKKWRAAFLAVAASRPTQPSPARPF